MKKYLLVFVVVLFASTPCLAGNPNPPPVDPKKMTAAKELASVLVVDPSKSMMEFMTKTWRQPMMRENPGNNKVDQISANVQNKMWGIYKDRLIDNAAKIYAQTFSIDEMHQMAAFFKSPAGQKYMSANIQVSRQVGFSNASVSVEASREAQKELVDELKKNNMKVPPEMEPKVVKKP